ncbi:MAG TPA: hypothetical protein VFP54_08265 [Acidimicrobiales bacterium]|nr:hypothetical protein [Acidimicrobiales bacterium]
MTAPTRPAATGAGFRRPDPMGVAAAAVLVVPFALALGRILAYGGRVWLPDDLASIDLDTRNAVHFVQQLGPFDRFGWYHPGSFYFYLLSIPAHLVGTGARAEFAGATLINLGAALASVAVVRRRAGRLAGLWAALCLGGLALVLCDTGPHAVTYSESPLGALVSPWNPMVVIFPLVLVSVLAAAAACGSALSLAGAVLVGSFEVQTNIATAPLVAVLLAGGAVGVAVAAARRRARLDRAGRWWLAAAAVAVVGVWVPTVVQQFTNTPGNLSLIWRFFTAGHPTWPLSVGVWSVVSVDGTFWHGLSQAMAGLLGGAPPGAGVTLAVVVAVGAATVAVGVLRRDPFAAALGVAGLAGLAVVSYSVTRVVGPVFGYLVVWEIAMPTVALVGLGVAVWGRPEARAVAAAGEPGPRGAPRSGSTPPRVAWVGVAGAAVMAGALGYRAAGLPSLGAASSPQVEAVWSRIAPHLPAGPGPVLVQVGGTSWMTLFYLAGTVDQLDARGYRAEVPPQWQGLFTPRQRRSGPAAVTVTIGTSSPHPQSDPGWVGGLGEEAVYVRPR